MDIVFPEYEEFHTSVVFYRIPKNASWSIYDHLGNANLICFNIKNLEEKADRKMYGKIHPSHIKPDEFKNLVIGENLRNYFSFSTVRNPWDRAVSMYFSAIKDHEIKEDIKKYYKIDEHLSFDLFCDILLERKDDPYFIASHNQTLWTTGKYPPQEILRFENLQEEFAAMVKEHNLITINPNLPHKNKTNHTHYSDYYNSKTRNIIADVFEEDIDTFEYSFEKEIKIEEPKDSIII